jgi:serine/threonine protein kinase
MERDAIFEEDERSPLALPTRTLLRDQFRIGRVLGVGGFGITYLALDEMLEMTVAVKEYFPQHPAVDRRNEKEVTTRSKSTKEDFGGLPVWPGALPERGPHAGQVRVPRQYRPRPDLL